MHFFVLVALLAAPPAPDLDPTVLARIRDAAMKSEWAYLHLAELTDKIGPRLSGSVGAEAAVVQVATAMKAAGLAVTLQPVKVPHWVRGAERGELLEYRGRPNGVTQTLHLTALGDSTATGSEGLTAQVFVAHGLAELEAHAAEAKGQIVLIDTPFDQGLADNGEAGTAYSQAGAARFRGAALVTRLGGLAALVRSVGGAEFRLPHTGMTGEPKDGGVNVPSAALSAEDAALIERLSAQGPVTLKLTLTPQTLPDADSHNVLADLKGAEKPDEVVIISGHLDSWDLGTGALDDGAGVIAAMAATQVLKSLNLQPKRTIRAIAFMNEENGVRGGTAYLEANKDRFASHVAAIESDSGAGRPLGLMANVPAGALARLQPVMLALKSLNATSLRHVEHAIGTDISDLQVQGGVPGFEPLLDVRSYFSYHHTAADTFDKVDPDALRRQVAVLAVLAYALAEMKEPLPRLPVEP
jgi:Zn-dependent M28 family amino/carboxypeptidase